MIDCFPLSGFTHEALVNKWHVFPMSHASLCDQGALGVKGLSSLDPSPRGNLE